MLINIIHTGHIHLNGASYSRQPNFKSMQTLTLRTHAISAGRIFSSAHFIEPCRSLVRNQQLHSDLS